MTKLTVMAKQPN